jgi:hypothetical protein
MTGLHPVRASRPGAGAIRSEERSDEAGWHRLPGASSERSERSQHSRHPGRKRAKRAGQQSPERPAGRFP